MLSGLKGPGGRMDSFDHKMSKSDPGNAILLDDDPKSIRTKIKKSFLEVGNDKSPIFEISRHVIMPKLGRILVSPDLQGWIVECRQVVVGRVLVPPHYAECSPHP